MLAAMLRRSGFTFTGFSSLPSTAAAASAAGAAAAPTPAAASTSAFITRPWTSSLLTSTPSSAASLAAMGLVLGPATKFSTSLATTVPLGPVPGIWERS